MIIRVRTNIGVWRVEDLDPATATPSDVLDGIAATRPHVVYERPLSSDPRCDVPLDASTALSSQQGVDTLAPACCSASTSGGRSGSIASASRAVTRAMCGKSFSIGNWSLRQPIAASMRSLGRPA